MFNCQKCSVTSKPQEKPLTKVIQTRPTTYYKKTLIQVGNEVQARLDYQGVGFETVLEMKLCKDCFNQE